MVGHYCHTHQYTPRERYQSLRIDMITILLIVLCLVCLTAAAVPVPATTPLQSILAGGAARSIAQFITYPMDALRTLAQTRKGAPSLKDLGPRVLISGCFSTSMFAFPTGAIQFTVFASMKKILTQVAEKVPEGWASVTVKATAVAMLSSACASITSCAVG